MVRYERFDDEEVSYEWFVFLSEARQRGVPFRLNEGHRTFGRQQFFYDNQPPLAAKPSPNAPHIRTGRLDHAIDVNGSDALIKFGRTAGVPLTRTVRGETWHLEADRRDLVRYAEQHAGGAAEMALRRRLRMAYAKRKTVEDVGPINRRIRTLKRRLSAL